MSGTGTPGDPWNLTTPAGGGGFQMHIDPDKGVLHCQVGKTWLHYQVAALDDLYAMLKQHGDWVELGNKDEKQDVKPGTVEAWGRSADNPVGGWYGLRKGYRGRFANYVTPVLKEQGKVEFEKRGRGWWVRAL
jgi:hypothetical protein